jgi:hypothetical protein
VERVGDPGGAEGVWRSKEGRKVATPRDGVSPCACSGPNSGRGNGTLRTRCSNAEGGSTFLAFAGP